MNNQEIIDAYQRVDEAYKEEFKEYQRLLMMKREIKASRPKSNNDKFINQIDRIIGKVKITLGELMDTSIIIKSIQDYKEEN